MDNLILSNETQGVLTITLNRLNKQNSLTTSMYKELCQLFKHAAKTNNIHCVVLQGNDSCFCAGNDLTDFLENPEATKQYAFEFVKLIASFEKPLIAAVAGPAIGIGTTLLLHCDVILASKSAVFQLPFTLLGLCPEAGASLLLPLKIGHNNAFELLALGKSCNAEQALNYGLINQCIHTGELLVAAQQTASKISKLPQDALTTTKSLMKQTWQEQLMKTIDCEAKEFSRLLTSEECKNSIKAFFHKKK
jgi:enoyl-CoA hydratase/carnithine racemase